MTAFDLSAVGRKSGAVVFVAVFHVAIIYALATGLGRQVIEIVRAPLETKIIDEVKPKEKALPPPPKLAPPPPPSIPIPDFQVQSVLVNAITTVASPKPVEAPPVQAPPVEAVPIRVPPVISKSGCRQPEYPSVSRRLEEVGQVLLAFLVDVDGRVVDGRVEISSGFERLDTAALNALQLCQFKPGTIDGKPEQSWAKIKYVWKLN